MHKESFNTNMAEHHDHSHTEVLDELWQESERNPLIEGLKQDKPVSEIIDKERLLEAFREMPCCLGCSDGRIHEVRFGRAGMGIVAGVEATVAAIKELKEQGKLNGKLVVKSHDGCGAAKIVCSKLIENGSLPADTKPDSLGVDFAAKVVAGLAQAGIEAEHQHTAASEMDEIHNERLIYFDGTGRFNIEKAQNGDQPLFPRGFIFTDMALSPEETETELKALCGIALGDHGFGERFTKDNPFRILISAENSEQLSALKGIADSASACFEGRVAVSAYQVGRID